MQSGGTVSSSSMCHTKSPTKFLCLFLIACPQYPKLVGSTIIAVLHLKFFVNIRTSSTFGKSGPSNTIVK